MLYRVLMDGTDILDYDVPDLVLIDPQVSLEIDTSGSFTFTVPYEHRYYNSFTPESIMSITIEVWEDSVLHFFGRPIELQLNFNKDKTISCEGALAYFNDSIIEDEEFDSTYLSDIFQYVIGSHNSTAANNRCFSLDCFFTVNNRQVYRKFNYESCFDALKTKFLEAEEGHFFLRRENGENYIDFLKDFPYRTNQQVVFSENLLDMNYIFDGKDFATCVIPLGAHNDDTDSPTTIASVNGGSIVLEGPAVVNYGKIIKVQNYGDIKDPSELMAEGYKYLTTLQYNAFTIECSAVDRHSTNNTIQPFRLGQMVTCVSSPHGITTEFPISKMTLRLDRAEKEITLGNIPKKTLARFYKPESNSSGDYDGGGGGGGGIDGWTLNPPSESGGTPTMIKVPTNIVINTPPTVLNYQQGSAINFEGLSIRLLTPLTNSGPLETFTDPDKYPTGIISYPSSELRLPVTKVVEQKSQIKIPVIWQSPYDMKQMQASFTVTNLTQKAIEDAHGGPPDHIEATITKIGGVDPQVYKNGNMIHMNGVKVYAYWPDGTRFDANGYKDGYIPITEITYVPKVATYSSSGIYPPGEGLMVQTDDGVSALAITFYEHIYSWGYDFIWNKDTIVRSSRGYRIGIGGTTPSRTILLANYQGTTYGRMTDDGGLGNYRVFPTNGASGSESGHRETNGWYSLQYMDLVPESSVDPRGANIEDFPQKMEVVLSWKSPYDTVLSTSIYVTVRPNNSTSGYGNGGR